MFTHFCPTNKIVLTIIEKIKNKKMIVLMNDCLWTTQNESKYFQNVMLYRKLKYKHQVKFSCIYSYSFLNFNKIKKSLHDKSIKRI